MSPIKEGYTTVGHANQEERVDGSHEAGMNSHESQNRKRNDVYDILSEDDQRVTKKAKQPIASPKTTSTSSRALRGSSDKQNKLIRETRTSGRLRPTKNLPKQSEALTQRGVAKEHEPGNDVEAILMDPSPKKPATPLHPPAVTLKRLNMQLKTKPSGRKGSRERREAVKPAADNYYRESEGLKLNYLVEPKTLEQIRDGLGKVGQRFNREDGSWSLIQKSDHTKLKGLGKSLYKCLDDLHTHYASFQGSQIDPNKTATFTVSLQQICMDKLLNQRRGGTSFGIESFDEENTQRILKELYFILIPKFFDVVKTAIEVYTTEEPMSIPVLEEIRGLIGLLSNLVGTVKDVPKELQPKGDYQISKPVSECRPKLRELSKTVVNEINRRKRDKATLEAELRLTESREAAKQEEELEAEERRADIARTLKAQKRAIEATWEDPVIGPIYRAAFAKEAKKWGWATQGSPSPTPINKGKARESLSHQYEDVADHEEEDVFADVPSARTSFPPNNKRDSPPEWNDEEFITFIEIMQAQRGPDRYEIAAEEIGRPIEDIFRFAKEYQQDMDDAHERGELDEECDAWTYDIWPEE